MKLKSLPRQLGYILGAQWTRDLSWTIFTILLARRSPEMLGQIAVALSCGYLVKTVSDVGLNDFLLSTFARREERPRTLLGEVTGLKTCFMLLALVVTWFVTGWLGYSFELRLIVLFIATGFGLDGVTDSFFALCQARGRQDVEMRIRVPSALLGIGYGIVCVVAGAPLIFIALYKLIESVLCTGFAFRALGRNPFVGFGYDNVRDLAVKMKSGFIFTIMAACAMFYNKINVFFLKNYGGDAAVGILTAAALLIAGISIYSSRQETRVLNVYNWGEYISDGSDDSLNTITAFEEWYKATYGVPVKVNYDTYASNEDMYAKLKSGAVSYDVVIPSDYMIARMESEDMLLPLNYDNIPNYQYISEDFRGLYYDPDDTYTVPYTYGIVGVIYNANVVDAADAGSWDLMWNPKYAGNILQYNNARDALGTAMYRAGIDVNTTDHAAWERALQALVDQRPLVKSYVMDEIYNMMESGEAAVASYYAGDYFTMCDAQAENVDLQFYYPDETNYFIDAMCIPSCCQDQELAECFINFMLSREAAVANAEYIYYASPNRLVYEDPEYIEDMGEDTMDILYPGIGSFRDEYNRSAYRNLDQATLTFVNSLWETLKIN